MLSQEFKGIIMAIRARTDDPDVTVEEARANMEKQLSIFRVAADIRCTPVDAGGVAAEWVVAPEADDGRVILYLHGGGYVMGSLNTHREMVSHISRAAQAKVLLIDYRLAPENRFPAALDDATGVYKWLLDQGADPAKTVIAGDSAGGGLAVAALVTLRDEKQPLPAAAVCLSPWADLEVTGESMETRAADDPLVQKDAVIKLASAYLGDTDPRNPLASPIYADLHGLPPMLITVGTAETLYDDASRLAQKAESDGVETKLEIGEDLTHVWQFYAALARESKASVESIGEFIRQHT